MSHPGHAHHFASPQNQFESGKLGIWLFLVTEIVLFGGLFCAYAVYRATHPEIFYYAYQAELLSVTLGGVNTVVLICSSLTMAWAVRAAQLGKQKLLVTMLILTLLGACGFLAIKGVEYEHKWKKGLLPGKHFAPKEHSGHGDKNDSAAVAADAASTGETLSSENTADTQSAAATETSHSDASPSEGADTEAADTQSTMAANGDEQSLIEPAAVGPRGLAAAGAPDAHGHGHDVEQPDYAHIFFSIYFIMTGLHGLHVIAGMVAIAWVLVRAVQGTFGPAYFMPVDGVGLYWHLVDLIWIFLFPLLYLIH